MKACFYSTIIATALLICARLILQSVHAQDAYSPVAGVIPADPSEQTNSPEASPIYGVTIPPGYRDWQLIAVNQLLLSGKADQLRAQLGNDIAIKAFKEGKIPFPDGSIIAAIHWTRVPSETNNEVLDGPFPGTQSFVVGSVVNVQFMVKDSKKYAESAGWGFADFTGPKPADKAMHETCFPCHAPAKDHHYIFTHYAP